MRNAWNQAYQYQYEDPYRKFGLLNDALRSIMGGSSSTTGPNPNYTSGAQNAATYAALIASMFGD